MELVDTHCHLQFSDLAENIDQVMANAAAAGVKRMISVGTSLADSRQAIDIAQKHENVWAAVGIHPHEANRYVQDLAPRSVNADDSNTRFQGLSLEIADLSSSNKVVAIGEIGLDFYKDYAPREAQIELLKNQIEASLPSGLPFIFHVRDSFRDFWPIFDEYKIKSGVIHSFSAGSKQLEQVLSRGLLVGLNGIMTFTRDESQLEAARRVPLDRLVLETDAPFLTPNPHRGQACEPKHVRDTAEFLANLRGENLEDLASASTANAVKLFGLKP